MGRRGENQILPDGFFWHNEPDNFSFDGSLTIQTNPKTDYWQKTHYGFTRNDGHSLLKEVVGDFAFSSQFKFSPNNLYDQCGIIIVADDENWAKVSIEYENSQISRLGSVVTNLGFSDWATTDISSQINSMHYRVSRRGDDFLFENSCDGENWLQVRIFHMHSVGKSICAGVYACSPSDGSFECRISNMQFYDNSWQKEI